MKERKWLLNWKLDRHWAFTRKDKKVYDFRFAPPTVSVVSWKVIFLPFFLLRRYILLFYVNIIMYSFLREKYDGKNVLREKLLFCLRFAMTFPFLFISRPSQTTTEMESSCHQRRQQTNSFFFVLLCLLSTAFINVVIMEASERSSRKKSL